MTEIITNASPNYSSYEPRQVETEEEKNGVQDSCTEKVARFCRLIPTVVYNLFVLCGTGCTTVCRDNSVCQRMRSCCAPVLSKDEKNNDHRMH